jgi:hypothetical protein
MNKNVIREQATEVKVSVVFMWDAFRASPWYAQCATYIVGIWVISVIAGLING